MIYHGLISDLPVEFFNGCTSITLTPENFDVELERLERFANNYPYDLYVRLIVWDWGGDHKTLVRIQIVEPLVPLQDMVWHLIEREIKEEFFHVTIYIYTTEYEVQV